MTGSIQRKKANVCEILLFFSVPDTDLMNDDKRQEAFYQRQKNSV